MPPRGSRVDRLAELERGLSVAERNATRLATRDASVPRPRRGAILCEIDDKVATHDFDTDGDVKPFWWDGAAKAEALPGFVSGVRDWLLMPGQALKSNEHAIAERMDDDEWWLTGHRQVENFVLSSGGGFIGGAGAAVMSIVEGSQIHNGFSIVADKLRILYAGEYGYDFGFFEQHKVDVAGQYTLSLFSSGTPVGMTSLHASKRSTRADFESRSGMGMITAADDTDLWLFVTDPTGSNSGGVFDSYFLRVWSINLYPR